MYWKLFIAALVTIALSSCGGGTSAAQKQAAAKSVAKTQKAFKALNLFSQDKVVLQAPSTCDSGSVTVTGNEDSITISTPAGGCTEGTTKFVATNFSITISGTQNSLSITYNGSIVITDGGVTTSVSFSNFSFTITVGGTQQNPTITLTLNGTMTVDGQTVTFNNEAFNAADLE